MSPASAGTLDSEGGHGARLLCAGSAEEWGWLLRESAPPPWDQHGFSALARCSSDQPCRPQPETSAWHCGSRSSTQRATQRASLCAAGCAHTVSGLRTEKHLWVVLARCTATLCCCRIALRLTCGLATYRTDAALGFDLVSDLSVAGQAQVLNAICCCNTWQSSAMVDVAHRQT